MPIEIEENLITVNFDGSGDICVTPIGTGIDKDYYGLVMIEDEPGLIGEENPKYKGQCLYSVENKKVFLSFYNPASIDILIKDLEKIKKDLSKEY